MVSSGHPADAHAMRRAGGERGQTLVEWLGVMVALVALCAMLAHVLPKVASPIASAFECAVQRAGGGDGCDGAGRSTVAKAPAARPAPGRRGKGLGRLGVGTRGLSSGLGPSMRPPRDPGSADAREALIRAGHIPPPGPMTFEEADRFLHNYERAHRMRFSAGDFLLIAGRLHQGVTIDVKPADMAEPEWARRTEMAMNALSLLPVGKALKLGRYLSERLAQVGVRSAAELDEEAAQAVARAVAQTGEGRGPAYGTRLHAALRAQADASPNLRSEVSYLNRREVPYGTKGSVRLDIIGYKDGKPAVIYDLKSGSAKLTARRIQQIRDELPPALRDLPVEELRP
jgi:hypothetical protein